MLLGIRGFMLNLSIVGRDDGRRVSNRWSLKSAAVIKNIGEINAWVMRFPHDFNSENPLHHNLALAVNHPALI